MLHDHEISKLTDTNLLSKIGEEASEVIHAAMKFQVHGMTPTFKGVDYDNLNDIYMEYLQLTSYVNELMRRFQK